MPRKGRHNYNPTLTLPPGAKRFQRRRSRAGGDTENKFRPELVGQPRYPKTEAAWEARRAQNLAKMQAAIAAGTWGRIGIPTGWRRNAKLAREIRARNIVEAKKIVEVMVAKNLIDGADDRAVEAMEHAVAIARDITQPANHRNTAIRTILEWSASKPAAKTEVSIKRPEDWLSEIAKEAGISEDD